MLQVVVAPVRVIEVETGTRQYPQDILGLSSQATTRYGAGFVVCGISVSGRCPGFTPDLPQPKPDNERV